ncbi:MAG: cupin domain-containing protein [Betaproteobacteria bacterium]|nr:cupin domain-containing protein [Betaproteobacteria bacterium]
MAHNATSTLLGGLTAREFLRDYWQQKPLLVRGAIPDFEEPITAREVRELAAREEALSRLVVRYGRQWTLEHGPIRARRLAGLMRGNVPWTVLVQDVQHHSYEAHDLLARFNFLSSARIDDLMVSIASKGGGVGPHVDSYDVFLLQGTGRRRWRISRQEDLALAPGLPLKILKRFRAEEEYVLEKGDMLYLPPQVAHHGIAIDECVTWSIGFRAPRFQEVVEFHLDARRDALSIDGQYRDPGILPSVHPGTVSPAMQASLVKAMSDASSAARSRHLMLHDLGCFLTTPKPHVVFDTPESAMTAFAFARAAKTRGVRLTLATRLLRCGKGFFVNGGPLPVRAADADALQRLADTRVLPGAQRGRAPGRIAFGPSLCRTLHEMHATGALELLPPAGEALDE